MLKRDAANGCADMHQGCFDRASPGFTSQAGDYLNVVLSELCQNYDFDLAKQTYSFTFNTSQLNFNGQAYQNLPANYLRSIRNQCWYFISGVPYPMIHLDQNEGDLLVEQSGVSNFPVFFWTDMTLMGATNSPTTAPGVTGVPVMLFWMPPSGAYAVTLRYFSQMTDIATPSTIDVRCHGFPTRTISSRASPGS